MGKGRYLWQRLTEEAHLSLESLPGQSIVEITGDRRVLIENHFGVKAYGREQIVVKVKYGFVTVCGRCLELLRMTNAQLVICGDIHSISIQRRNHQ